MMPLCSGFVAGREDGAVDIGRAGIGRVIVLEDDAGTSERGQSRSVSVVHEIRSHSIPDDDDDVLRLAWFVTGERSCDAGQGARWREETGDGIGRKFASPPSEFRAANRDDQVSAAREWASRLC